MPVMPAPRLALGVLLVLAPLTLLATGCAETPAQGFEAFYDALVDGRVDGRGGAAERLTARARGQLGQAAALQGLSPEQALSATFPKTTIRSIGVVQQQGDDATLDVTDPLGKSERVHMKREDGRWKVDLAP